MSTLTTDLVGIYSLKLSFFVLYSPNRTELLFCNTMIISSLILNIPLTVQNYSKYSPNRMELHENIPLTVQNLNA